MIPSSSRIPNPSILIFDILRLCYQDDRVVDNESVLKLIADEYKLSASDEEFRKKFHAAKGHAKKAKLIQCIMRGPFFITKKGKKVVDDLEAKRKKAKGDFGREIDLKFLKKSTKSRKSQALNGALHAGRDRVSQVAQAEDPRNPAYLDSSANETTRAARKKVSDAHNKKFSDAHKKAGDAHMELSDAYKEPDDAHNEPDDAHNEPDDAHKISVIQ